jgi:hypothetical protein
MPFENADRLFTFANYSYGSVFHGYVDNFRVRRAVPETCSVRNMFQARCTATDFPLRQES